MFRIRWWPEEVPIDLSNLPPDSRRILLREVLDELGLAAMKRSGIGIHLGPDQVEVTGVFDEPSSCFYDPRFYCSR